MRAKKQEAGEEKTVKTLHDRLDLKKDQAESVVSRT